MISSKGFALLIGVDDYSAFDPAMSLKGSREDVLKLYWMCRRLLGLSPENIRVLASPPLTAADFHVTEPPPPDRMGPATADSIKAGVDWLAGQMASDGAAPGLLTYSGHGSYSPDRGPLLCPSDMGRDLVKGIAVRDLSKSQALQSVKERLTVMLDCCHAAPVTTATDFRAPTALPHDGTPEQVAADHADFDISERVLLAARPGQHAHQALLGKVFHGALTFALVTVAEQWKASQDPDGSGMHVSYKQLLKRVRRMLWSLRMKQSVRLRVPAAPMSKRKAIRKLPFFGTHAATTVRRPDAPRTKVQTDPGLKDYRLYTITGDFSNGDPFTGYIVVPNASQPGSSPTYQSGNEYWYVPSTPTGATLPPALTFTWADNDWSSTSPLPASVSGYRLYTTTQAPSWRTSVPILGTASTAYVSESFTQSASGIKSVFVLAWDLGAASSSLNWYVATTGTSFGGTVFSSTGSDDVPVMSSGVTLTATGIDGAGIPSGTWTSYWTIASNALTGVLQT